MKNIIISLVMITLVASLVVGATRAIFFDTETSFDNTFAAGTLDLTVDGEDDGSTVAHIELSDMKPGDGVGGAEHSTISYQRTLCNTGTLPGQPWIEIVNLRDNDNGCNEPESGVDSSCGDPGLGDGELSANLLMQVNAAGSGGFEYPHGAGCVAGRNCPISTWAAHGPVGQGTWETIPAGGCTAPMVLEFAIPTAVGNIIQSDSTLFDIVFHLVQI